MPDFGFVFLIGSGSADFFVTAFSGGGVSSFAVCKDEWVSDFCVAFERVVLTAGARFEVAVLDD